MLRKLGKADIPGRSLRFTASSMHPPVRSLDLANFLIARSQQSIYIEQTTKTSVIDPHLLQTYLPISMILSSCALLKYVVKVALPRPRQIYCGPVKYISYLGPAKYITSSKYRVPGFNTCIYVFYMRS